MSQQIGLLLARLAFGVLGAALVAAFADVAGGTPALAAGEALLAVALWVALATPVVCALAAGSRALRRPSGTLGGGFGLALAWIVLSAASAAGVAALRAPAPAPAATPDGVTREETSARTSPDVVLIVLDTQRADHLGPWAKGPRARGDLTPAFDAFAREGTIYERAFATASWTVPSHASLFTGLWPISHGASWLQHRWLVDETPTLAEALRARGYRTVALVANHWLGLANLLQGFDEVEALGARFRGLRLRRVLELIGAPARWMDHGAEDAVDAVGRVLGGRTHDRRPLFLFVNLLEPHWRHLPPLADRLAALPPGLGALTATRIGMQFYGPLVMAGRHIDGPLDRALPALYAGAVRHQDRAFGRIVSTLRSGLDLDRALVVVTADHGENLGDGGRFDHVFALNDALVHVPLVIRHPARFAAGVRVPGLASLADVPPTIADVLGGLELAADPDARTLAPDRFVPRPFVVSECDPYFGHLDAMSAYSDLRHDVGRWARPLVAIRDETRKLVAREGASSELFAPDDDPEETTDRSATEPERAATLEATLAAWRAARTVFRDASEKTQRSPGLSDEDRARLRSLGYLQ